MLIYEKVDFLMSTVYGNCHYVGETPPIYTTCIVASNLLIGQMSKGTKENFILQVIVKVDKNLNKSKR